MVVVSTSPSVLEALRALHFKQAFWARRSELLSTTRFLAGWPRHAGVAADAPPRPVGAQPAAARAVVAAPLTRRTRTTRCASKSTAPAAARIHAWRSVREVLDPIPVLAIPGYSDNDSADFYDDLRKPPLRAPFAPPEDGAVNARAC